MIKAEELRIGNIHKHDGLPILNVDGFGKSEYETITAYGIFQVAEGNMTFEPIPLTEKWLEKFGLKLSHWMDEYEYDFCMGELFKGDKDIWKFEVNGNFDTIGIAEIKYVHQLQNLYFALTNSELKVKENVSI